MDEITSGGREQGALGSEQGSASDMQGEDDRTQAGSALHCVRRAREFQQMLSLPPYGLARGGREVVRRYACEVEDGLNIDVPQRIIGDVVAKIQPAVQIR